MFLQTKKFKIIFGICLITAVLGCFALPALAQIQPPTNTKLSTDRSGQDTSPNPVDVAISKMSRFDPLRYLAVFLQFLNDHVIGPLISMVAWAFNIMIQWTNSVNNKAVILGWTILRDIANMFFILVMLILSIATILRFNQYGVKTLLPKVIIVALLINFSRLFAFGIIDFSNVFTNAFLEALENDKNEIDVSAALAEGLNLNKIYKNGQAANIDPSKISDKGVFGAIAFNTIILIIIFCAMAIGALVMIVRLVWLWLLVMIAPIAFLGYMLPWQTVKEWWGKWWANLFKWAFFAPMYLFFIYIVVVMVNSGAMSGSVVKSFQDASQSNIPGLTGQEAGVQMASEPTMFLSMAIVLGFLIGGLMAAMKIAGEGGALAVTAGKWAGNKVAGGAAWLGRKGSRFAAEKTLRRLENKEPTSTAGRYALGLATRTLAPLQQQDKAEINKIKEKYKGYTPAQKRAIMASTLPGPMGSKTRAALAASLAEDKELKTQNGVTDSKIVSALKTARDVGMHGDILKARPDLAGEIADKRPGEDLAAAQKRATQEAIARYRSADDFAKLQIDDIKDGENIRNSGFASASEIKQEIVNQVFLSSKGGNILKELPNKNIPLVNEIAKKIQTVPGVKYEDKKNNLINEFKTIIDSMKDAQGIPLEEAKKKMMLNNVEGAIKYLGANIAQDVYNFGEEPKKDESKEKTPEEKKPENFEGGSGV